MRHLVTISLCLVGLVHVLPVIGVLGPHRLEALYGVEVLEPNLLVLMRHRAVLFGLLGSFLLFSAFRPELHRLALIAGFISVLSFLVLALAPVNAQLTRVVTIDLGALALLFVGAAAWFFGRP